VNVLVTYDVRTDSAEGAKRLRQVAKICENYGVRVQNSVFECTVDSAQLVKFRQQVTEAMDLGKDSLRIYYLGKGWVKNVEHHGAKDPLDVQGPLVV